MNDPRCQPRLALVPLAEREATPDRLADLLECLADVVAVTADRRLNLARITHSDDPRVRAAIADLARLEGDLRSVSVEAASVHQRLIHEHLL
jgi:DUF1680 family protein